MGEQISIRDLANELIEWAGLVPEKDIQIAITGLRPGERLEEKLVGQHERLLPTSINGIDQVDLRLLDPKNIVDALADLRGALDNLDHEGALKILRSCARMLPEDNHN
jgi:O-antigen biosynthesis protein WbqV